MDFRRRINLRPTTFAILGALAVCAGCRQNQAARELMERDLRLQEDRIYRLEAELDDARRELRSLRDCPSPDDSWRDDRFDSGALRFSDPPPRAGDRSNDSQSAPLTPPSSIDTAPPAIELPDAPSSGGSAPPFRGPPAVVPPDPNVPEGVPGRTTLPTDVLPPPFTPPGGGSKPSSADAAALPYKSMSSPRFVSPSQKPRSPEEFIPEETADRIRSAPLPSPARTTPSTSGGVQSITLGRATGGAKFDAAPGDDGVTVVVEARDARGEIIAAPAAASIVLIDPAVPGAGGRFARWDFTAEDAAALFRGQNGGESAGQYFELPWPEAPPAHSQLKLFVRFTTADGRQLQADRDVVVELASGTTQASPPGSLDAIRTATTPAILPAGVVEAPNATVESAVEVQPAAKLQWGRGPTPPEDGDIPRELPLETRATAELMPSMSPPPTETGPELFPAAGDR